MDSEKVSVATLIERANTELFERMYSEAEDTARLALEWYPQEASQFHLVLGHVFMQKTPPRLGVAKWHFMEAALAMLEIEKALEPVRLTSRTVVARSPRVITASKRARPPSRLRLRVAHLLCVCSA